VKLARLAAVVTAMGCRSDPAPSQTRAERPARSATPTPDPAKENESPDSGGALEGIVRIESAGYDVCALDREGRVYCWGQLDRRDESGVSRPWRIAGLPKIRDLRVTGRFAAIGVDDRVYYWGWRVAPYYERPAKADDCKQCDASYELDPALDAEADARAHPDEVVAHGHVEKITESDYPEACFQPQCRSTRRGFWSRTSTPGAFLAGYGLFARGDRYAHIYVADRNVDVPATDDLIAIVNPDVNRDQVRLCRVFASGTVRCDIKGLFPHDVDEAAVAFDFGEQIRSASSDHYARGLFVLESGRVASVTTDLAAYVHPHVEGIAQADGGIGDVCGIDEDGEVMCWLQNPSFAIPPYGPDPRLPRRIDGLRGVKQVATGLSGACALGFDARVRCWGANTYGQCGVGYASEAVETPTVVVAPQNPEDEP
jgi:hypothetical protein